MDELEMERNHILIQLACAVLDGTDYRAEWDLDDSRRGAHLGALRELLREGLVAEVQDLHCRWRLTNEGRRQAAVLIKDLQSKIDSAIVGITKISDELEQIRHIGEGMVKP